MKGEHVKLGDLVNDIAAEVKRAEDYDHPLTSGGGRSTNKPESRPPGHRHAKHLVNCVESELQKALKSIRRLCDDADISGVTTWLAKFVAFLAGVPSGGKVGYMDTTAVLPGYTELIELGESFDAVFGRFYRASIAWDGSDPVRSFI